MDQLYSEERERMMINIQKQKIAQQEEYQKKLKDQERVEYENKLNSEIVDR